MRGRLKVYEDRRVTRLKFCLNRTSKHLFFVQLQNAHCSEFVVASMILFESLGRGGGGC